MSLKPRSRGLDDGRFQGFLGEHGRGQEWQAARHCFVGMYGEITAGFKSPPLQTPRWELSALYE